MALNFDHYERLDEFIVAHLASAPVELCACTLPYDQNCDALRCRACRAAMDEIVVWCSQNLRDRHGVRLGRLYVRRALVNDAAIWNVVRRGQLDRRRAARPAPAAVEEDRETCAICMEELSGQIALIPCAHRFHVGCIIRWVQRQRACPMCRRPL